MGAILCQIDPRLHVCPQRVECALKAVETFLRRRLLATGWRRAPGLGPLDRGGYPSDVGFAPDRSGVRPRMAHVEDNEPDAEQFQPGAAERER
jgi:hypothetical protein